MGKVNKLKIDMADWLFNSGLIGLYRILRFNGFEVTTKDNYLEFDISALNNFGDKYFKYFIEKYNDDTLWFKVIDFYDNKLSNIDKDAISDTDKKSIDTFISEFSSNTRLNKPSYVSGFEIIGSEKNLMKDKIKILKDKNINYEIKLKEINNIYQYLKRNGKILRAKDIIYSFIYKYWSDKSFLLTSNAKKDMYTLYNVDFIKPVIEYIEVKEKKDKVRYWCIVCGRSLSKKSFGFDFSTWLKNIGIDNTRKASAFWNYDSDTIVCPICNLVYSCIPAGFETVKNSGIFVNYNQSISDLIRLNETEKMRYSQIAELENMAFTTIINLALNLQEQKLEKEIGNIQIIKYNEGKYHFNLLSKRVIKVLKDNGSSFEKLAKMYSIKLDNNVFLNVFHEVLINLYNNQKQNSLIALLIHIVIERNARYLLRRIYDVLQINLSFLNTFRGDNMKIEKINTKKITVMKLKGSDLRKGYQERKAENKINGIAYRMLNFLKTKNSNGFLDVLINCHMYLGKEVPTLFLETINDTDIFQSYGYAFLIGFLGEEYKKITLKEDNNNE